MTDHLGARLARHFGTLRQIDTTGFQVPDIALPARVGPYFAATEDEPLSLGDYATSIDARFVSPDTAPWLRLGTDQGAEICVDPSGAVQAVFVVADVAPLHVNADVPSFLESLLALDEALPTLRSPGALDPVEAFRVLHSRLVDVDASALEDDESWWSRVLELIRHALSFPASVAFEIEAPGGNKRIETEETQVGVEHPEILIWERLSAQGVRPEQVTRVYTELEPCFMPGNYCAMWLNQFRNADFTYSHDYGATSEEREAGLLELIEHATST